MIEQVMDTYRRMLNVEEVPPQLIAKYDKFKRLLDRVDGRLNAQGMAVVAVMAGYDLDAQEFPGADTIDKSPEEIDEDQGAGEDTVEADVDDTAAANEVKVPDEDAETKAETAGVSEETTKIDSPAENPDGYVEGMTVKVWFDNRAIPAVFLGMEDGKCKVRMQDGAEKLFEERDVTIPE